MDPQHLRELRAKEETYWWHTNKRAIVTTLVSRFASPPGTLLDLGCGAGLMSKTMEASGWTVAATDVSLDAARFVRDRDVGSVFVSDAGNALPLRPSTMDVILMLDMLEHVQDEAAALASVAATLKPGGIAILTVPAHAWLFSPWDEALGHHRRYSRHLLRQRIHASGLRLRLLSWWNLVSLLPAALLRMRKRRSSQQPTRTEFPYTPACVQILLKAWGRLEALLICRLSIPCGLSLVAVLERGGAEK